MMIDNKTIRKVDAVSAHIQNGLNNFGREEKQLELKRKEIKKDRESFKEVLDGLMNNK